MESGDEDGSSNHRELTSFASSIDLSETILKNKPSPTREREHAKSLMRYEETINESYKKIKEDYGLINKYNKVFRKFRRHLKAKMIYFERHINQKYLQPLPLPPLDFYSTENPWVPKPILVERRLESFLQ